MDIYNRLANVVHDAVTGAAKQFTPVCIQYTADVLCSSVTGSQIPLLCLLRTLRRWGSNGGRCRTDKKSVHQIQVTRDDQRLDVWYHRKQLMEMEITAL